VVFYQARPGDVIVFGKTAKGDGRSHSHSVSGGAALSAESRWLFSGARLPIVQGSD